MSRRRRNLYRPLISGYVHQPNCRFPSFHAIVFTREAEVQLAKPSVAADLYRLLAFLVGCDRDAVKQLIVAWMATPRVQLA